ncbi:DUF1097 domain-containing protein [Kribbella sandramycini]|uniref:DUF1097 domain-containing protein n=1 Tax=Kribbella sandramycini TaxID=60450 RepID=A0A7Y4L0W4_9ACTN|nr:DUF1097 domain-containing protein [Kribbella sandramycini]MBB6564560.1 hypothetical protein [Kribbella sandramycini]NOL42264.1 DUF1097 domain-containing protein [Kribbella sandramycini]
MKNFLGVGISVGLLAGIWTQVSMELALVTWAAFVAWACYFAAGGGRTGFTRGLAANISGALWGWLASLFLNHATFTGAIAIAVTVVAFILCMQAAVGVLSFIPGAFAGTAVFFGTSFDLWGTLIALVAGACLGWLSDLLGQRIQRAVAQPA